MMDYSYLAGEKQFYQLYLTNREEEENQEKINEPSTASDFVR